MTMRLRARKLVLTAHIATSVGWFGAVAVFLALGIMAMTSTDIQTVRATYLAAEPAAWSVVIPLAVASLLTGLLQSFVTTWGLVRHWWIVFKLVINLAAVAVLLAYAETLGYLADVAAQTTLAADDLATLRSPSVATHSVLALLLLLLATALAVYKPRGMTKYGRTGRASMTLRGRSTTER
jgi:hypothetical protein